MYAPIVLTSLPLLTLQLLLLLLPPAIAAAAAAAGC
jgi:hypothetical protein